MDTICSKTKSISVSPNGISPFHNSYFCKKCGRLITGVLIRSHIPVWIGECKCGNGTMIGQEPLLSMVVDYYANIKEGYSFNIN